MREICARFIEMEIDTFHCHQSLHDPPIRFCSNNLLGPITRKSRIKREDHDCSCDCFYQLWSMRERVSTIDPSLHILTFCISQKLVHSPSPSKKLSGKLYTNLCRTTGCSQFMNFSTKLASYHCSAILHHFYLAEMDLLTSRLPHSELKFVDLMGNGGKNWQPCTLFFFGYFVSGPINNNISHCVLFQSGSVPRYPDRALGNTDQRCRGLLFDEIEDNK
jgi:hypothetical protein